jgi:thiol-disulfide isomerase/thioredoxin
MGYTLGLLRKHDNLLEGSIPSDFKAVDLNDQTVSLSQFKGKNVVLLDFWASTCPPCRNQIPHFKQIYKKYHPKGLEIIAIAFLTGETINEDICLDYPIFGVPKTILINKDGKVAGSWVFYSEENVKSIDKKLAELIKN